MNLDVTLTRRPSRDMEMWAGLECTVNRVGERYGDQMERSGHAGRLDDLERFAGLGIRALRYPVLWERTAPDFTGGSASYANHSAGGIDWTWAEQRLNRLRELDIRPIVGLVHHGSGPRHTSLAEPCFAEKLACYAGQVAERFPWVQEWTPVNEPLTTARFSGLYGHWFPHGRDERTFARALLNQCRATILSMRAIRRHNPAAQLVQTDDLGKIYSTPRMRDQADFENERRWLGWDLLCGRVNREHRMWWHLLWAGIGEPELEWFLDNPCPPDVIGVNHYLTSERFLDERLERYPVASRADNGRDRYADVEAVRVLADGTPGVRGMIQEAWERYGLPVAITEAHLGCTREEQMRWLLDVWTSACDARLNGVDVRGVTAWALLGSYDWDSLLTDFKGSYETGIFDMRGGSPRPTALAGLVTALASGQTPSHPVVASPGWWRRPKRLLHPPAQACQDISRLLTLNPVFAHANPRPILIAGANGALGYAFARLCDHRHLAHVALARPHLDIADAESVEAALSAYRPWAVINAAGYSEAALAEAETERCERENVTGASVLAAACARHGLQFLTLSSSHVFEGGQEDSPPKRLYTESDAMRPLSAYGRSKAQAEICALALHSHSLIVRPGACFGPWDERNFLTRALADLNGGQSLAARADTVFSVSYVPDLVHACLDLLIDGATGIWHLVNPGSMSAYAFLRLAADRAGLNPERIVEAPARRFQGCSGECTGTGLNAGALGSERGALMRPLEEALECYLRDGGRERLRRLAEEQREHVGRQENARSLSPVLRGKSRRAAAVKI